jgi:hypothetical protein
MVWPIASWVNLWSGYTSPVWFDKLMMSTEFLFFALFFLGLASIAHKRNTDQEYLGKLRNWTWIQGALFVVFTVLVYVLQKGFITPYGAVDLLSLGLAIGVTIRMRQTVEAVAIWFVSKFPKFANEHTQSKGPSILKTLWSYQNRISLRIIPSSRVLYWFSKNQAGKIRRFLQIMMSAPGWVASCYSPGRRIACLHLPLGRLTRLAKG